MYIYKHAVWRARCPYRRLIRTPARTFPARASRYILHERASADFFRVFGFGSALYSGPRQIGNYPYASCPPPPHHRHCAKASLAIEINWLLLFLLLLLSILSPRRGSSVFQCITIFGSKRLGYMRPHVTACICAARCWCWWRTRAWEWDAHHHKLIIIHQSVCSFTLLYAHFILLYVREPDESENVCVAHSSSV